MAEEEGFEPPDPFPSLRFSRPVHSTTLSLLRIFLFFLRKGRDSPRHPAGFLFVAKLKLRQTDKTLGIFRKNIVILNLICGRGGIEHNASRPLKTHGFQYFPPTENFRFPTLSRSNFKLLIFCGEGGIRTLGPR